MDELIIKTFTVVPAEATSLLLYQQESDENDEWTKPWTPLQFIQAFNWFNEIPETWDDHSEGCNEDLFKWSQNEKIFICRISMCPTRKVRYLLVRYVFPDGLEKIEEAIKKLREKHSKERHQIMWKFPWANPAEELDIGVLGDIHELFFSSTSK